MKIVNILGGLGNQMFVYAMYKALSLKHPDEEVLLCTRSFKGYPLHNGFELADIFGVTATEASLFQLTKVAYPFFNYKSWQIMNHWLPTRHTMKEGTTQHPFDYRDVTREDSIFYDGYWQNEGNFKPIREEILRTYTFPEFLDERNIALAEELKRVNAVSCHIRRGDYLKDPVRCVCTQNYYRQALENIRKDKCPALYCIFSDDIEWCRQTFGPMLQGCNVIYVDWNKGKESYRDMQLMSLCHYNIIANSSFSWWGAWLNNHDDKVVLAPEIWMKKTLVNDPICKDWIRIKSE